LGLVQRLVVVLALSGALAGACAAPAPIADAPAVHAASSREPLPSASDVESPPKSVPGFRELELEGFLPAVFFVPAGEAPARLVVATHGAGGAPEWECDYWRALTRAEAFVLCLRGKSMGGGSYYYPHHHALEAELRAAERAARASEPRILPGSGIYAGFSQGASMGSAMVAGHGAAFPYLVLIEGFERWNIPRARAFAASGGKRVLFACGTPQCSKVAEDSLPWLKRGGIDARLEHALGAGHTPAGEVMERVQAALSWLVAE
jgi:predicted esterase